MINAAATEFSATTVCPAPAGLASGTEVLTLKGARPVETLRGGDRIITRSGACTLRDMAHEDGIYRLDFDRPQVVLLTEGQIYSDTGLPYAA